VPSAAAAEERADLASRGREVRRTEADMGRGREAVGVSASGMGFGGGVCEGVEGEGEGEGDGADAGGEEDIVRLSVGSGWVGVFVVGLEV